MRIPSECRALIMAGGRSQRMRATAGSSHKALVPILGVSLLERNLRHLLDEGFRDIVVAVSSNEPEIGRYLENSFRPPLEECGASLEILWEDTPLGTIG